MKFKTFPSPTLHLFNFDRFPPSVANLNPALTINGLTVYPTLRYNGKDAGASVWNPWGYGKQLALQAGTAPTYNNGSPLLGNLDDSVMFNSGGYFQESVASSFSGTPDLWIEALIKIPPTGGCILAKTNGNIATQGLSIYSNGVSAQEVNLVIKDAAANTAIVHTAATLTPGTYHFLQWGVNMSDDATNGIRVYRNAVDTSTLPGAPNVVTDITSTGKWTIGNASATGFPYGDNILYIAIYAMNNWFAAGAASPTEWATVAANRFAQLLGIYPQQARGTALPTSFTRATGAYLDKVESNGTRKIYQVGSGWLRACKRLASNSVEIKGYLPESSGTNICTYSNTFSSWTAVHSSISNTPVTTPDGYSAIRNTIQEDGYLGQHYLHITTTGKTVSNTYTISLFAKAAGRNWVFIEDGSGKGAYFNLSTGVIGTLQSATAAMESFGNGWYRCSVIFAAASASSDIYIIPSNADNDAGIYQGTGINSTYVFGAQEELGNYPTSYIPTVASPVARNADVLEYKMDDGNLVSGKGTMLLDVLLPNYSPVADGYLATLSNAGSSTVRISSSIKATTGVANDSIVNSTLQANISGTTNIANGKKHTIRTVWDTNDAKLYVESAQEGSTDTSVSIPTITRLDLSDNAGTNQANALISNLKIFGKETLEK